MDAIEFVIRYPDYISQLEAVVRPEHLPAIEKLKALDPHDIVKPEYYFNSDTEAVNVVFSLFLRQLRQIPLGPDNFSLLPHLLPLFAMRMKNCIFG